MEKKISNPKILTIKMKLIKWMIIMMTVIVKAVKLIIIISFTTNKETKNIWILFKYKIIIMKINKYNKIIYKILIINKLI